MFDCADRETGLGSQIPRSGLGHGFPTWQLVGNFQIEDGIAGARRADEARRGRKVMPGPIVRANIEEGTCPY